MTSHLQGNKRQEECWPFLFSSPLFWSHWFTSIVIMSIILASIDPFYFFPLQRWRYKQVIISNTLKKNLNVIFWLNEALWYYLACKPLSRQQHLDLKMTFPPLFTFLSNCFTAMSYLDSGNVRTCKNFIILWDNKGTSKRENTGRHAIAPTQQCFYIFNCELSL